MCCWPGHVKRNTFVRCRNGRSLLYYRLGRDYEKHDVNHNIDQLFLVENVCDYQQSGALNAQLCWICSGNCSEIEYIRQFWPLQIAQCTLHWHALHKMCNCSARRQEWASEKKKHFTLFSLWKCADTQMHQLTEIKQRNVCHIRKVCMRNSMRCNSADIIDNRRCQGTIPINMSNLAYWNSQRAIIFIHNKYFSANHVPRRSNPSNSTIIHFSANFRRYRIRRVLRLIHSIAITSHVRRTYS